MKVIAYMPIKDEVDRYLEPCLRDLSKAVDEIVIYDDRSTDDSVSVAKKYTDHVTVRPSHLPSFLEHEGRFRQAAWDYMVERCNPTDEDWILAIDADEWIYAESTDLTLRRLKEVLGKIPWNYTALMIQKHEIFDIQDGVPQERIDGYWGSIIGTRLVRFLPGGTFNDKAMGCGSEPSYCSQSPSRVEHDLFLLHYGYVQPEDRVMKHERYTTLVDHGHSNSHIASIVAEPELRPWTGRHPELET